MKRTFSFSEIMLWIIMLLPYAYLAIIWDKLPETVATHFDINGEPNGWSNKTTLIWLPGLLIFLAYGLFWLIPKIDPKKKLEKMGDKYEKLKWIFVSLMSIISIITIFAAQNKGGSITSQLLVIALGIFFVLIGNYFQTITHNYFIGIRTPWTLESDVVWKKTHKMAGKWWMAGGLLSVLAALILPNTLIMPVFISITLIIAFVPIIYSYIAYKRLGEQTTA